MSHTPPVKLKETEADRNIREKTENAASAEIRQFVERYEQLETEKKDISDQQKEVMSEAKARGYDTKALKQIVMLRKRSKDDIAEEEAVLQLYKEAMGM